VKIVAKAIDFEQAVLENLQRLPEEQKQEVLNFVEFLVKKTQTAQLERIKNDEYELLKAAIRNPAFEDLKDPTEDIYTLADGKQFYDPEWAKSVLKDPDLDFIADPEEDIYTLADGKPFYD
jgi:mRNA-degrading endonuclease RelE of RelBE toxin-antitoxin system